MTKFVEQFATNIYHFAIRKGTRIILCVKSEGNPGNAVGIVINEKISPGSIILRVSEKHWLSGTVPQTLEDFLAAANIERLDLKGEQVFWTIGGFVMDSTSGDKYILTSAHCIDSDVKFSNALVFLSAVLNDEQVRKLH